MKLPSDLFGVTQVTYRFMQGDDRATAIGLACNEIRDAIEEQGVR